jgi:hypothetical protein
MIKNLYKIYNIYFTCDSMFVNHVKSLIIFISQMEFFQDVHYMYVIWNFDK